MTQQPTTRTEFTRQIINDMSDPETEVSQHEPWSYTKTKDGVTEEVTLENPDHPSIHSTENQ